VTDIPIRVYVVEDHPVMRQTLSDYLGFVPDIDLCGMARTADEAVAELEAAAPELVVMDLSLPGRSGIDLMTEIRSRWNIPCLILSGHGERGHIERAFAAGARGYVLKGRPEELPAAIRRVRGGGVYLSESLQRSFAYDLDSVGK
jgi:DNA-binding NarL/FixJ family response regulator